MNYMTLELTSDGRTKLSAANVEAIGISCLFGEKPIDDPDLIKVEGIMQSYGFSRATLAEYRAQIIDMIAQLDPSFMKDKGGGWTFLNMIVGADHQLWTGEQRIAELLCCLAIGLDYASWLMPRDLWSSFPGGVPYIAFG